MIKAIQYSSELKMYVLGMFGKTVDKDKYIVEKSNPSQRVLTPDGQEIHLDNFAGFRKGSVVIVKNDLPSLIQLLDILKH
jgi:hypothetical protein